MLALYELIGKESGEPCCIRTTPDRLGDTANIKAGSRNLANGEPCWI
jgi:hypothetical protein